MLQLHSQGQTIHVVINAYCHNLTSHSIKQLQRTSAAKILLSEGQHRRFAHEQVDSLSIVAAKIPLS